MGHRLIERDHTSPYQPWQVEVRPRDVPHQSRQDLTGPGGAEPNQHQLRQSTAYLERVASPYQPRQTEVDTMGPVVRWWYYLYKTGCDIIR
ncbi:hypothetical protein NQZ68_042285 [Dissostichus eleginoides]|nr:hypothetical protein NQZ68_042285 [Dissostichus eleginoides]